MSDFPGKLGGTDPIVPWLNKLREASISSQLNSVVNGRFTRGPGGTSLVCAAAASGVVTAFGIFLIKTMRANDMVCHTWDGTIEGSTDINVAKCQELTNPTSEVIDGVTVNYSGYGANCDTRVASDGGYTENQNVSPRFVENTTIIYAAQLHIHVAGVDDWDWIDLNVAARAWTRIQ